MCKRFGSELDPSQKLVTCKNLNLSIRFKEKKPHIFVDFVSYSKECADPNTLLIGKILVPRYGPRYGPLTLTYKKEARHTPYGKT